MDMNFGMTSFKMEIEKFDPNLPINEAKTPPGSWYTRNEFFHLDKELLLREWQIVGHIAQVISIGEYFEGQFLDIPFFVIKTSEGPKAYRNTCSHHGTILLEGQGKCEKIRCPYHGWEYNFKGQIQKASGSGLTKDQIKSSRLKEIPLKNIQGYLFLFFGSSKTHPPIPKKLDLSLEKHFNLSSLKFLTRKSFKVSCNWKVFVDNYLDGGYHIPTLHEVLDNELDYSQYYSEIYNQFSIQSCNPNSSPESQSRSTGEAYYLWLFPNYMINRYGKWMDTNWVIPMAPDKCEVIFNYFVEVGLENSEIEFDLKQSEQIQIEDEGICEKVHKGMKQSAFRGVYAPTCEKPMFHFHQLLFESYKKVLEN